jgi:hypothetical protein
MERFIGSSHYRSTLSRPTLVKVRAQGKKFFNFSTEQNGGEKAAPATADCIELTTRG